MDCVANQLQTTADLTNLFAGREYLGLSGRRPFERGISAERFCAAFGQNLKRHRLRKGHGIETARSAFHPPLSPDAYLALEVGFLPSKRFLLELAAYCGCRPGELIFGEEDLEGSSPLGAVIETNVRPFPGEGLVPLLDQHPAALDRDRIRFFSMANRSMVPTIAPGTVLLVGPPPVSSEAPRDGIAVFKASGHDLVRRVTWNASGVRLSCDNDLSGYGHECLSLEEYQQAISGIVISALIFFGGTLSLL